MCSGVAELAIRWHFKGSFDSLTWLLSKYQNLEPTPAACGSWFEVLEKLNRLPQKWFLNGLEFSKVVTWWYESIRVRLVQFENKFNTRIYKKVAGGWVVISVRPSVCLSCFSAGEISLDLYRYHVGTYQIGLVQAWLPSNFDLNI